jgi:mono/diheme cytochrome c family protein
MAIAGSPANGAGRGRRVVYGLAGVLVALAAGFFAWAWYPEIAAVAPPARASFDQGLIEKGALLAKIGNCSICHTAAGGRPFAGGRPLATPFGTIYSTNITPDAQTGIGAWPEAAFTRAMRRGVDRAGRHLYPAFPYPHFTKLTDDDIKALYAFQMTREPVSARAPENKLPFPLDIRLTVAGWNLLFLERGVFRPDPAQSEAWNRGAYLVEALADCGGCHTPRNSLGAEKKDRNLGGGTSEGWDAYALNAASPAPVPWNAERMFTYLHHTFDDVHGAAAGLMAPVAHNLARASEQDVQAMVTYVMSIAGTPTPARQVKAAEAVARAKRPIAETVNASRPGSIGAAIYAGACAQCHETGRGVALALSTAVAGPTPRNLIHILLQGIHPAEGEPGPLMPAFAGALTEAQMVAVITFVRANFSDQPAWPGVENDIRRIQQDGDKP